MTKTESIRLITRRIDLAVEHGLDQHVDNHFALLSKHLTLVRLKRADDAGRKLGARLHTRRNIKAINHALGKPGDIRVTGAHGVNDLLRRYDPALIEAFAVKGNASLLAKRGNCRRGPNFCT